ncbi:MAG TPA: amidohydrolase family protein [Steroidobacteraceae bacterium]|nr:amidohydrolase family protein [Steroidobacteraceae bacterium]
MSTVPADLTVSCRWIWPMTSAGAVLENHTLVIRDGRILDLLPTSLAAGRYAATAHVDRPHHVVLPGLVNAHTRIAPPPGRTIALDRLHDGARMCIAEMLEAGTTCFCGVGSFPQESARAAAEQGMRAIIGIPIAETPGPWAASPGEYLTRALSFRDEYRGHPTIATAFALQSPAALSDATFARIAMLADELDAGIVTALHESRAEVDECVIRHGARPIARLHALGLLTPALTAAHMAAVNAADLELAQRGGIAVTLCPESSMRTGAGAPPVSSWAATGLRLSLGSGVDPDGSPDLWTAMRFLALLSMAPDGLANLSHRALDAWDALAVATRGGAAALGLDAEIGTLEKDKWADLCCIDLQRPALQWAALAAPQGAAEELLRKGGRDLVSDVWVSGRHLVNSRAFTRLDWPRAAERVVARSFSPPSGDGI